jgi:hypothetical protein
VQLDFDGEILAEQLAPLIENAAGVDIVTGADARRDRPTCRARERMQVMRILRELLEGDSGASAALRLL